MRVVTVIVPVGVSAALSVLVVRRLGRMHAFAHTPARIALAWGLSTAILLATDRVTRRLLPLAVLLRLSLAFPDEAPSRLKLARQAASLRKLEEIAERARREGMPDQPARAAEQILSLVAAVESHDRATRGHSERVRIYTELVADELKLARRDHDRLRWAALLHDVGKVVVPREILRKPARLTDEEWSLVRRHPEEGARLAAPLFGWLGEWSAAIEEHHEWFDGAGYPHGLAGAHISFGARIVSVADAFETMTARRTYRRPMRAEQARQELVRFSGRQFDPVVVRAFLAISVRRLRWVSGPLSWLAQAPFLRGIEQAATAGATAGGALIIGLLPPAAPPAHATRPPNHIRITTVRSPSAEVVPSPPPVVADVPPVREPTPAPTPVGPPADPGRNDKVLPARPSPSPSASAEPAAEPITLPTNITPPVF